MPNFCCRALCLTLLSLPWRYSKLWPLCNPLNYFWMILDPFLQFVQLWIFSQIHRVTNDYIHDVQLPTFHVIRQTFLTSYSSLYTSQPHQAHTCYSHAQTHTKDCIILAQCWIISFLKDYYGIYLVKWINTEVFFNCSVNIVTVSNTILYSLRIELETYFFFLIYHIWPF